MTLSRTTLLWAVAALVLPPALATAHDFWIEPETFFPTKGLPLRLRLFVGHDATQEKPASIEERGRDSGHLLRFVVVGPDGATREIVGIDGRRPAGYLRVETAGPHVVAYESRPRVSILAAARFERYLREEGLETIVAERARRRETQRAGVEAYSRCAKTLIASSTPAADDARAATTTGDTVRAIDPPIDREIGLPLELVRERAGEPAKGPIEGTSVDIVRVLFRGKPLAGALVEARAPDGTTRSARTTAEGRVRFRFDAAGVWRVTCVHMLRGEKDDRADWRSFWASTTFAIAGEPEHAAPTTIE